MRSNSPSSALSRGAVVMIESKDPELSRDRSRVGPIVIPMPEATIATVIPTPASTSEAITGKCTARLWQSTTEPTS